MTPKAPTSLPIPSECAHVALFGGTFDPPHLAHVTLADLGRRELEGRVSAPVFLAFVPAARSPHKDNAPTATDAQRLDMLALATEGLEHAGIWTDELDRATHGEPSYWARTLERAKSILPDRTLWFIIGADQATSFHRWRTPREMLQFAQPTILPREPITSATDLRAAMANTDFWNEKELDHWAESFVDIDSLPAASTEVRDAKGSPFETPLHPKVLAYARQNALYGLS
ncbi:MAG: nicotinate-nicotinamide nucleotide adenylyltransferase [Phycisphaera sp.]|nr:MAG: nicotinate-nicotinamide nucleotide adenylyltransferase [Phycisphaera sp.]